MKGSMCVYISFLFGINACVENATTEGNKQMKEMNTNVCVFVATVVFFVSFCFVFCFFLIKYM
jgi:hypothetical protein